MDWLAAERGVRLDDYQQAWEWSVRDLDGFWSAVWEFFSPAADGDPRPALARPAMPGAVWFPGVRLNYAEAALARRGPGVAVCSESQTRPPVTWSADELAAQVSRLRAGLVAMGVDRGDRVAAYLPNLPETVAAFLATASLGAIWSSCAPEFGVKAVVDRFAQIAPKVLLGVDGYRYGERDVPRTAELRALSESLPSLAATVMLPYLDPSASPPQGWTSWEQAFPAGAPGEIGPIPFQRVPFDHPLYVLYSSGTTGPPKAIVHCQGGILLEHLKTLAFHHDLGEGDRFFWFSTTGWMMWNYLVSGLLVGSAIICYDGNPAHPDLGELWRLAERASMTYLGTSASFLMSCRKAGLRPSGIADLSRLRSIGSTGSPLPAEGFLWVRDAVGARVHLASTSGGTDVCTPFVGASPLVPVWAGEISCRCLGVDAKAFDPDGRPVVGTQGELVVTQPMPTMPVGLWGDEDGSRYRATYFEDYPGVWRHGDWATFTERGSCIITGRSDATLNRGGVRLGTSELYSVVEAMEEIADSLVVHMEQGGDPGGRLLLFVVPAEGAELDASLVARIREGLRRELSPRHAPDEVHAVAAIPRTLSGKKLEVPVKRILAGVPAEQAASREALADPSSLEAFERLAAARGR
ncbi:MAG: acetoacetate--CoA ligase [Acidimicrobiales bacterium]